MGLFDSLKKSLQGSVNSAVNGAVNNALSGAKSNVTSTVSSTINKGVNSVSNKVKDSINTALETKTKKFKFDALPSTLDEFKALPGVALTDYYATAALAVIALNACAENFEVGCEMIDYLNGPNTFTPSDQQFIKMQLGDGRSYVPRSYFKGAKPENNYTPDKPYEIEVIEAKYSKENFEEGYITLYIQSGGADSPRLVTLRNKKSTGEWFLNDYRALLTSIRISQEQDAWA